MLCAISAAGASADDRKTCALIDGEASIAACTRLLRGKLAANERADIHAYRGATHVFSEEYDLGLKDLNEALHLKPGSAYSLYNRGLAYFFKEDYKRALTDFERAAQGNPKSAPEHFYKGRTLSELGRHDEAIEAFTSAIGIRKDDARYFRFRADARLEKSENASAIADYTESIRLNPQAIAYRGRGIGYFNQSNYEQAVLDLTEAIRLDADDWYSPYMRANAYALLGRYQDAIADHTKALRLDAGNARVLNGRADALMNSGNLSEAMVDVERALKVDPEFGMAVTTRAEVLERLGRKEEAIAEFKRSLAIDDSLDDAKIGLQRLGEGNFVASRYPATDQASAKSAQCQRYFPAIGRLVSVPCSNQ